LILYFTIRYPINSNGKAIISILKHLYVVEADDFDEYILQKLLSHYWFGMYIKYFFDRFIFNADNVAWYYFYILRVITIYTATN